MTQLEHAPRYLRFARALALVSGIAGPMSGCALQHGVDADAGREEPDAAVADSGPIDVCSACTCVFGGDTPPPPGSCEAAGHVECCYLVGPLSPPDLPA